MKKIQLFTAIFFCFISTNLDAQIDKTFWFAAPDITSGHVADNPIKLVITSFGSPASVTISQPANSGGFAPINVSLAANSVFTVDLSGRKAAVESFGDDNANGDRGKDNSGILIQSNQIISAYYEVAGGFNDDLFSLKGANGLGNKFIVTAQMIAENGSSYTPAARNRAYIIASEDNTSVTIDPNAAGIIAGTVSTTTTATFTITLNKGEVYVIAAASQLAANHLGGTIITSDKPVAVTMSDDSIDLPSTGTGGQDLAGDQLVPTRLAGKEFITSEGNLDHPYTDVVFVYPINAGTSLMLNGASYTTGGASKGPGEFWEIRNNTGAAMSITTSDSVLIFQLAGNGGEVGGGVIPPLDCTGSQSVSVVRSGLNTQNFIVTILVKQVDKNNFTSNVAGAAAALTFTNV